MQLARIDGQHQLEATAAKYFLELKRAAELAGFTVVVSEAYRTRERQQLLYDKWKAGKMPGTRIVAKPGKSAHEKGLSVDIKVAEQPGLLAWLRANAHTFGFFKTTANEPWHWTFISGKVPK